MESYLATHRSAATKLPIAVHFETLFPGQTDHFITHFGFNRWGGDRTNIWNSEAYFAGRYSLTMQIPVIVDYKKETITPAGDPTFYLKEITRCDGTAAWYTGGIQKTFGKDEWQTIYESDGDFSAIGVNIQRNAPVQNFDAFAQAIRSPRIPVTLSER
jgi:hypothetical protein